MKSELAISVFLFSLAACSSDDGLGESGSGTARFTVYGEDFIERGIGAEEFADGWSVTFEQFLLVLGDVSVKKSGGETGAMLAGAQLFNLVMPGPHDVGTTGDIASGHWDDVGYTFSPIASDTSLHASATAADRAQMETSGSSVLVRGTATKGAVTKTFGWAFGSAIAFSGCIAVEDGKETPGFVLAAGGTEDVELTIHGDHFFYDDLASPDAVLRFDAIARADDEGDADGAVTLAELSAISLVSIAEGTYGTGSASNVNDLGAFVTAQVATLGHYRGEGHCTAVSQ